MDLSAEPGRLSGQESFLFGRDGLPRPVWRAFLFALLYLLVVRISVQIYSWIFGPIVGLPNPAFYALQAVFLLLESWAMLALADRRNFQTLGIWFYSGWWREMLAGAGIATALMSVTIAMLVATRSVVYQGLAAASSQEAAQWSRVVLLLLLAASTEEFVFRGYALQRLMDSLGTPAAVLITSVLFGLAHSLNPSATAFSTVNTMLAGMLLSVAYVRTRALWLPIGLHFTWNFLLGPIFSLPVSGILISPVLFQPVLTGHAWLTGGLYGPEGGAALTVICSVGIIWLSRSRTIRVSPAMQEALQ